jgi:hypothetical protein
MEWNAEVRVIKVIIILLVLLLYYQGDSARWRSHSISCRFPAQCSETRVMSATLIIAFLPQEQGGFLCMWLKISKGFPLALHLSIRVYSLDLTAAGRRWRTEMPWRLCPRGEKTGDAMKICTLVFESPLERSGIEPATMHGRCELR